MKSCIAEEIALAKDNSYSKIAINSKFYSCTAIAVLMLPTMLEAIQRYFESRRRLWRESTAPNQERVLEQSKKRRIRARKDRVRGKNC